MAGAGRSLLGLCGLVAFVALQPARGEIFRFQDERIPQAHELDGKYLFYVYAHQDVSLMTGTTRDQSKGIPFVQFADFTIEALEDTGQTEDEVQVAIVPWEDFSSFVSSQKFCADRGDVEAGRAKRANQLLVNVSGVLRSDVDSVHLHDVGLRKPQNSGRQVIKETGVYVLVILNCGKATDLTISGSVIVRNSFGFLPGNEYSKLELYKWMALAYLIVAGLWVGRMCRWWEERLFIHHLVSTVVCLGLMEALVWLTFFAQWNSTGIDVAAFRWAAILLSCMKIVATLFLLLLVALGQGVTRPDVHGRHMVRMFAAALVYVVLDSIRMYALVNRQSYCLTLSFVLLCTAPFLLLGCLVAFWLFYALNRLLASLRSQQQVEKLYMYRRCVCTLWLALVLGAATIAAQLCDLPGRTKEWWDYHWVVTDALSGTLFLLFLAAMMLIWAPFEGGRSMAFNYRQIDFSEHEMQDMDPDEIAEMVGEEVGYDGSPMAAIGYDRRVPSPAAATIGNTGWQATSQDLRKCP